MKVFAVLLGLASVAVAGRLSYSKPGVVHQPLARQPGLVQPGLGLGLGGTATGQAGGNLVQGQSSGPLGSSQVQQSSAHAQGTATGSGSSFNQGSSQGSQSTGILGSQQTGSTSGTSIQQGGGPGLLIPHQPVVHQPGLVQPGLGLGLGGAATGQAGGNLVQGQSSGPLGSSQLQQSSANAQGTAIGGGSSFNQGSSQGSQSTGILGSQQTGGTSGTSIQQGGGPSVVIPHQGGNIGIGSYGK